MRKIILTLAALAAVGIALPVATTSASAETVVIKQNRGHHYGWRNHRAERVVIVKKRHHREGLVVREGRRHHGATVGVSVR
jgi:Spy/CpxP family protein refolding chaperone